MNRKKRNGLKIFLTKLQTESLKDKLKVAQKIWTNLQNNLLTVNSCKAMTKYILVRLMLIMVMFFVFLINLSIDKII